MAAVLERRVYGGAPVILRGAAANWTRARRAWSLAGLRAGRAADEAVTPHPIPHGETFGIPAPRPPTTLAAFLDAFQNVSSGLVGPDDVSGLQDYVIVQRLNSHVYN